MLPTVDSVILPAQAEPRRRDAARRWTAIAAAEAVMVVHMVLAPMHLAEEFYIGALFVLGNCLLFAAVLMMAGQRHRAAGWALGGLVCAGEFGAFVASRTVGLPLGYHEAWASRPEDRLGLASLACELVFLVALAWPSTRLGPRVRRACRS